jgi:protein-S-isoprenylcysteine O-methyltransferase Ste14
MHSFYDTFQIVALGCFLLIVLSRSLRLRLGQQVRPLHIGVRRNGADHLVALILFAGVNVWSTFVLIYALDIHRAVPPPPLGTLLIRSPFLHSVGVGVVILAFGIFIRAMLDLGDSWRLGIDEHSPGALVTTGIYTISRNPIYLFFGLYFLGTFLINGTALFIIFVLLFSAILHYQTLLEERFLARHYGQPFQNYCRATGRYLTCKFVRRAKSADSE